MRTYLAILPLVVIASVLLISVPADSADGYEYFDDGVLEYEVIENDTVTVSKYLQDSGVTDVVVPSKVDYEGMTYTVTAVMYGTFSPEEVISVTLPVTVEELYAESFSGINIQRIDVDPANPHFTSIDGIIYDYKLRELIRCPSGYQTKSVETPESLASIGRAAFEKCTNIESIKVNDGLILIDMYAFYDCSSLSTVTVKGVVNELPETLAVISSFAFSHCKSLTDIYLPEQLTLIGESAFAQTGLKELTIPERVDHIGDSAFGGCTDLKKIESDNSKYISEDGVLFQSGDQKKLFCYPAGREGAEYTIPNDVTTIAPDAFEECVNLKKVNLGELTTIPDSAFAQCRSLEEIDLSDISVIGILSFIDCVNLKEVKFGDNLYVIGMMAFESSGIEEFTAPVSLTTIGSNAFSDCHNLKKVTFPEDSECYVDTYAFWRSTNLTEMYIGSNGVTLEDDALTIGTSVDKVTLNITVPKGYTISETTHNESTELNITFIGERPYPYENLIGIIICILVLFAIFKLFRKV